MARVNNFLAVLVFCLMFLNVAMAWSCYCVDCGSSSCVRRDTVTRTVYEKGSKQWRLSSRDGKYHVYNIDGADRSWFNTLCDRNGAMGGTCF
ncbi:hypothetical protein BX616_010273 [Lobosporangium transversale]|uniref:Uncharacterized protein n=1 Tax=Lobosporangium transversale TaxID=64571 RepID=A0A1Y2GYJ3_9FUNG|nr:hypothetical protein BCR41DRAFT_346679 [Lobosporangium transversale]KAF9912658.1 hypothetical protein BX616_010273 [Lobosporangium transversale]ORZ27346.1 hypothetical protein BCR41DRAFT_346679 [Lobosporangium transversale]|eukprot:XP_021885073.1 hypothetical protein BCR41DRAFT_346679 [Lobosporangium transversale]